MLCAEVKRSRPSKSVIANVSEAIPPPQNLSFRQAQRDPKYVFLVPMLQRENVLESVYQPNKKKAAPYLSL